MRKIILIALSMAFLFLGYKVTSNTYNKRGLVDQKAYAEKYLGRSIPGEKFHSHYPPDPVNVRTGNFYLPIQDLYLPCFGFPIEVFRAYNSFSSQNGPFGIGWTFNYDLRITIGTSNILKVIEADGFVNEFQLKGTSDTGKGQIIDQIIEAKKKEDMQYRKSYQPEEVYDKMRIKLATDGDYFKRQRARYIVVESKEVVDGEYISTLRGTTTIIKSKGQYTRIREDGSTEYYNTDGYLLRIEDRNGNSLNFTLNAKNQVTRVSDGCLHYILVAYNPRGKIEKITDSLGRYFSYGYDSSDRLVSFKDSKGNASEYTYNQLGFMEKITFEKGKKILIEYTKNTGTVAKVSGPATKVSTYQYGRKANLRTALVTDNEGLYESYEFDDKEQTTVQKNKKGNAVTTVLSKTCSKPASVTDGKFSEFYNYDSRGNLIEKKDSQGGIVKYRYDPRFDQITEITDSQGQKLRFLYDARGNLTNADLARAGWVRIRYERHGKIETMMDDKGNMISYAYNNTGMPTVIEKKSKGKLVGQILVTYDPTGEIIDRRFNPNDVKIVEDVKKTLSDIFALLKPSGIDFQI